MSTSTDAKGGKEGTFQPIKHAQSQELPGLVFDIEITFV